MELAINPSLEGGLKKIPKKQAKENCLDNSPMDNFFGIIKQEIYYGNTFMSFNELKMVIE